MVSKIEKRELPLNNIVEGNCIEVMKTLPDHSVDMIFADPPYNLQLKNDLHRPGGSKVDAVNDYWDQFSSFQAYDDFTQKWLTEARRILKKDGTIWVIGSYHNIFRVGATLQDQGFWILNDVSWIKHNPMPNFHGRRLTNAHETLIWASFDAKSKYTFHYNALKSYNDDLQMRSDWYLPICNGAERLKDEKGQKVHATQKPESLLYRIIMATTNPGDVILDPFSGSGTTAAVAKKMSRNYIGIEQDKSYLKASRERLAGITVNEKTEYFIPQPTKRTEPRIPFGRLLEENLLQAGETLISPCGCFEAKVFADGTLQSGQHRGSIHQVSAALKNSESSNGWTYWYVKRKKEKILIDTLREEIKRNMKQTPSASKNLKQKKGA